MFVLYREQTQLCLSRQGLVASISLTQPNPFFGDVITFSYDPNRISGGASVQPRIRVEAFQSGQLVYSEERFAQGASFELGGGGSLWAEQPGDCACVATLFYVKNSTATTLATTGFIGYDDRIEQDRPVTSIFCCGAECGGLAASSGAAVGQHWVQAVGSAAAISTSNVRSGARSLRLNPTAASCFVTANVIFTTRTPVARFCLYAAQLPAADMSVFQFCSTIGGLSGRGVLWFDQASSSLVLRSLVPANGAISFPITTGEHYRIDFSVDANLGGVMQAAVNGVTLGTLAHGGGGQDQAGLAFGTGISWTGDLYIDDFVLSQTAADYPIGSGYVHHFVPTSDGTHNIAGTGDFQRGNSGTDILNATTTAWQLIDDVPLPSGAVDEADNQRAVAPVNATDYPECVVGPASGVPVPILPPRAVEVILAHHQIGTGAGSWDVQLNDNGTTDNIVSVVGGAGVTTYRYARKHYATPPTGGAWKVTSGAGNFNNLRSRFRCGDANPDACLDAIMIEAEFPEYQARRPLRIQQAVNRASTY